MIGNLIMKPLNSSYTAEVTVSDVEEQPSLFKAHGVALIAGLMGFVLFLLLVLIIGCSLRFFLQRRQRQAYQISSIRGINPNQGSYSRRTLVKNEHENFGSGSVKSIISRRSNSNTMLGACPPRHHSISSGCRSGSGKGRKMISSTSVLPSSGSSSRTGTLRLSRNPALSHNNRKQSSSSLLSSVSITNLPLPPPPIPPSHSSPTRAPGSLRAKPRAASSATSVTSFSHPAKWRYEPNVPVNSTRFEDQVPLPAIPSLRSRCNSNPSYVNKTRPGKPIREMTFDSLRSASSNTKRRRPINTMLENFGHKVPMEIHETNTEASQTTQVATCVADQDCSVAGSDCDENTKSRPTGAEQRDDSTDPTVTSQAVGSETGNSPVYTKVNLESRKSHVTATAGSEEVSVYHKLDYVTGDVATSRVSFVRKSPGPERNKSVDYFHEVLLRWGPKLPEDGDYDHLDSDFSGRFRITHKLRRPTADVNGKSPEEEHKSKPTVKSRSLFNVGNSNKKEKPRLKKTTI